MSSPSLTVPLATNSFAESSNLKVILASLVFSEKKIKAELDDSIKSVQLIFKKDDVTLIEANAIGKYLAGSCLTVSKAIAFEETVLNKALTTPTTNESILEVPEFFTEAALTAEQIIVFASLYTLKVNSSTWFKNFNELAEVKDAIKAAAAFTQKAPIPLPVRDGAIKVNTENIELRKHTGAILPKDGERNILVTSALPYVNNVPHLGNIVGSVLSADIYARYSKNRNYNTLFVCGTDEYGTATETKALEENCTPYELCSKYHKIHKEVYDWFQIGFDYFGRTTTEKQTEIAQDIFMKLYDNGYLEEQSMTQLYCDVHNGFLADRFVEGTCPKCGYEDARGDQCDGCGVLLNPLELINPRCKLDNATPVQKDTNHIFLSLDKLEKEVAAWNEKSFNEGKWSKNGKSITDNWLKEGLHPRCITRDLKWGTPVPLKKFADKVLYVWFDACIGYISITANYTENWEKWWKDPENVDLYQFMGKDNVPFHTVVFPATQIGTREKWTQLHHLSTTEYLQYEGGKFSKSRNIGVFGNNAKETGISPSVWRYYLASSRPETSDTAFSWQDFVNKNNGELLANLGNFVNRVIKFVNAKYNGVAPEFNPNAINYSNLNEDINKLLVNYNTAMESVSLRYGLEVSMQFSARGNQFLQDNKIDNTLFSEQPEKCAAVVGVALNLIYLVSTVISPFMPETTTGICEQLNVPERSIPDQFDLPIAAGHNINKAQYLFSRIDPKKIEEWRSKFGGKKN
ncbi:methionyl-tRNA synthetase [Nadsonia fulvescens var. elongata DSM 6958]|uniref:methionine--tRNA ligase n=1 Tax=Nadsonia fulvescens var. elongata DSM 6958 TaxID=857566 RepID=A0A1E3PNK6_9ASCO|nr:methionyl-tRNA synthetase [Nadsonia fulvescens var. elongata DSM 6958]